MKYKLVKMKLSHTPEYLEFGFRNLPCVVYAVVDKPFAWICDGEKCDFDYIKNNNIGYKKLSGAGGTTIVSSAGDLVLGIFGDSKFCQEMGFRVSNWFSKKINGGEMINNDFMYNGNKYGAATTIGVGENFYLGIQVSNNIDTELIEKICKKKSIKKPEGLPSPLTEKELISLFGDCEVFYEYSSTK